MVPFPRVPQLFRTVRRDCWRNVLVRGGRFRHYERQRPTIFLFPPLLRDRPTRVESVSSVVVTLASSSRSRSDTDDSTAGVVELTFAALQLHIRITPPSVGQYPSKCEKIPRSPDSSAKMTESVAGPRLQTVGLLGTTRKPRRGSLLGAPAPGPRRRLSWTSIMHLAVPRRRLGSGWRRGPTTADVVG